MINLDELGRMTQVIRGGCYPLTTLTLWNLCMANAEWDTGTVKLDRDGLAELAKVQPQQVSRSMKLLHEYGAVFTEHEKGRATYWCNPLVGWAGHRKSSFQERAVAMRDAVSAEVESLKVAPKLDV